MLQLINSTLAEVEPETCSIELRLRGVQASILETVFWLAPTYDQNFEDFCIVSPMPALSSRASLKSSLGLKRTLVLTQKEPHKNVRRYTCI